MRIIPKRRRIFLGEKIVEHVPQGSRILDIGSGSGRIGSLVAMRRNSEVVFCDPLREPDLHLRRKYSYVRASGCHLPFQDNAFDVSLIVTALHHIANPSIVLSEAKRVTQSRIIVIEDVYRNRAEKWITGFNDSLLNKEWFGHPHQNKRDREWMTIFKSLGMTLVVVKGFTEFYAGIFYFRHSLYVIDLC